MSSDLNSLSRDPLPLSRAASRSARSATAQLADRLSDAAPARRLAPSNGTFNASAADALTRWKEA